MSINKVILLGYTGKDPEVKDVAGDKGRQSIACYHGEGLYPSKRDPGSRPHGMA